MASMPEMRLHAFIARCGLASRRAAERMIAEGRVRLNGAIVDTPGIKVGDTDRVEVDGKAIELLEELDYILLNKPPRYLCSSFDPEGRPLALSLLGEYGKKRLYSIGRLDFMSSGLILFTNDGGFAAALGHPSCGIEKEYEVRTDLPVPDSFMSAFQRGLVIEGTRYKATSVTRKSEREIVVVLIEGRNREIRRVLELYHVTALSLRRTRIGPIDQAGLPEGSFRILSPEERLALLGLREGQGLSSDHRNRGADDQEEDIW